MGEKRGRKRDRQRQRETVQRDSQGQRDKYYRETDTEEGAGKQTEEVGKRGRGEDRQ